MITGWIQKLRNSWITLSSIVTRNDNCISVTQTKLQSLCRLQVWKCLMRCRCVGSLLPSTVQRSQESERPTKVSLSRTGTLRLRLNTQTIRLTTYLTTTTVVVTSTALYGPRSRVVQEDYRSCLRQCSLTCTRKVQDSMLPSHQAVTSTRTTT